jgi:hypothetical protein
MAFTETGTVHCDISAYNILLINPETHYVDGQWNKPVKGSLGNLVWNCLSTEPLPRNGSTQLDETLEDG